MTREERLRDVDARAKRYQRELEEKVVRAVVDVRVSHPVRGWVSVPKGGEVVRSHYAVERRPDGFQPLDAAVIERRVKSWRRRLRTAWNVD